jgi:RHS repeat-associated protein
VRLDEVTGLLQMRNRYYSVETGRFLTRDPIGVWGDLGNIGNEYGYAWGRPLVVGDALGLQGETNLFGNRAASSLEDIRSWIVDGKALPRDKSEGLGPEWRNADGSGRCFPLHGPYGTPSTDGGDGAESGFVWAVVLFVAVTVVEEACGMLTGVVYAAVEVGSGNIGTAALELAGALPGVPSTRAVRRGVKLIDDACYMLGRRGVRTPSWSLWHGKNGGRLDVENPNPGQRPGQLHYQDEKGNKYLYDPDSRSFPSAPNFVNEMLTNDKSFADAVEKGITKYLGGYP